MKISESCVGNFLESLRLQQRREIRGVGVAECRQDRDILIREIIGCAARCWKLKIGSEKIISVIIVRLRARSDTSVKCSHPHRGWQYLNGAGNSLTDDS